MKKIKLLFAAVAAMVTMVANAQSWIASEVGEGNFHLYNIGKNQFLTRGNGWGTQASAGASALTLIVEEYNGAYKLRTNLNGDGKGLERLGDPVIYTDQSNGKNSTWTFTKVADASNGPIYTIVSADNHGGGAGSYMTASADNTIVGPADAVTDDYGKWQLIQSWITNNMPVTNADGWTTSQTPTFDNGNICAEFWNKSGASIKQTVRSLPAGSYELIAVALTREGMTATLNAGSNTKSIATVASGTVNNRVQAKSWFDEGNGVTNLEFTHAGGDLEIGLTADNTTGDHWLVWRSFVLLYKGVDLTELKASLQAQIDAVPALQGTTTTAAYNAAKNYADAIDMDALTTEEAISTASSELAALVAAATALQNNYTRYQNVKAAVLAISEAVSIETAESQLNDATTNEAINTAISTLRAALLAKLPELTIPEDPGYIDVTAAMVDNASVGQNVEGWTVTDVVRRKDWGTGPTTNYNETEFYQSNFRFYQTLALTPGTWEFGVTGFHRAGNHNTYFYAGTDKILIPGVESSVVNSMAEAKTYFDGGNGKVALKFLIESAGDVEIGIDNQDTETDCWTIFRDFTLKYYGAPDYSIYATQWEEAKVAAEDAKTAHSTITSGDEYTALNTAIADEPTESWKKADYLEKIETLKDATSAFVAAATIFEAWPTAVAAANTAKTNNPNVTGTELTALNAAIADVPEANNKTSYEEKTTALTNATNDFTAAAPSYNQYVAYKAETIALWGTDFEVTAPTTAAEALVAVQNLNIAQYNKVASDYTFSATGLIGDFGSWTGTATVAGEPAEPNYLDWEHWSGVTHAYYEQAAAGWGNENGWTIQYQKTCTLPAGSYVIKVAARSSAGVTSTVSCSAIATTISLPCANNNTRGINTSGVASWNAEDEFISTGGKNATVGGTGAGWQWRFLPFTLAEQTEVTMTFYGEASTGSQWMSIGDGELLSTTKLAQDVAYDEAKDNTITNTIIADVTMTRTIKVGYNTVCLPFTLTANQVTAVFGAETEVYNFTEDSADPMRATINFNKGDGSITANVPVLVKATVASDSQTFQGVQIVATGEAKVEGTNFDFVGTYAPITVAAKDYFISKDALYKSEGTTSMKAFRAYIFNKDKNNGAGEVKMFIDGEETETAISTIDNGQLTIDNSVIYNVAGQRISKLQKGINIVNGKKILK